MNTPTMRCPKCGHEWPIPCQQTDCISKYGECIVCRFVTPGEANPKGSGSGTHEELAALASGEEAKIGNGMNKPTLPASLYDATHRCYGDAYSALQMEAYAKEWLEYAAEACDLWKQAMALY